MQLVDTSIWIATFRRRAPLDLEAALRLALEAMTALPIVESPLSAGLVDDAIALYRDARRAGWTARSSVDCLIAACAIRHDLEVLHADGDYAALARVSPLRERRIRP